MKESFIVITGLSGSGKSAAVRVFEDLGYFCVDNLPVALIPVFADLCARSGAEIPRVALVIDIREGAFLQEFPEVLTRLRQSHNVSVLFFEADDPVLARRFSETRRPHPMTAEGEDLQDSLRREHATLAPIRSVADAIIDTSAFTVHDLKSHLLDNYLEADRVSSLLILLVSFGYKYGVPDNVDLMFDVRFMSNPYFVEELRAKSGRDPEVLDFLQKKPEYHTFLDKSGDLLRFLLPLYVKEGKSYLRIAVGCTGGQHRSVAVAEELGRLLAGEKLRLRIQHRDMGREEGRRT